MSAIEMTCDRCGAKYLAGVVGSTPWPAHECPPGTAVGSAKPPIEGMWRLAVPYKPNHSTRTRSTGTAYVLGPVTDGEVPVVPCDEAAVERAAWAIREKHGAIMPLNRYRKLVREVFEAAGRVE